MGGREMWADRKILVIEDESLICDVIAASFEDWAEIDCALTGDAGAQKLVTSHYDLVIIDGILPDTSGLRLAEFAANQNTPVLIMTGYPDLVARLDDTDFPVLAKPFTVNDLLFEAQVAIAQSEANIRRVKQSLEIMKYRAACLEDALNVAKTILDDAKKIMKRSRAMNLPMSTIAVP
jgi:DNA-binding response OmpR family regulator